MTTIALFIVVIVFLFIFIQRDKRKRAVSPTPSGISYDDYMQQMTARYGQPADTIDASTSPGPSSNLPILLYPDFMVIDSIQVYYTQIKSVSFNNSSVPYTVSNYQVIVNTVLPDSEFIHFSVGDDIEWARSIAERIRDLAESKA